MKRATSYENDLFLSYAHIDNEPLIEGQRGWVSTFRHTLETRLSQLLGVRPKVWWDPKLRGNDAFAEEITVQLGNVALFVSVVSPSFLESDWCRMELAAFHEGSEASGGPWRGRQSRVFKVLKTPVPREDPAELRKLLGYEFYRYDTEKGTFREVHQDGSPEDRRVYLDKLEDLAQDICRLLRRLQENESTTSDSAPPEPSSTVTLYVAESTFDTRVERDRLLRSLAQRDFLVLPEGPLPFHGPELRARVSEDIRRARLSIHLLGANYGAVPEAETVSVAELQNEIAAERCAADPGFQRLIWLPSGLEPNDDRQRRFIDRLRTDSTAQYGAEIVRGSLEDLKTVLSDQLEPERPAPAPALRSELQRIYLICDPRDHDGVDEIGAYLFDQGFEVIKPLLEGDEATVQQDHRDNLVLCDGLLVFYGHANELWLRYKLLDLRKCAGYGPPRARAKAIYLAPPKNDAKVRLRTHEALVIPGFDGFSPELLEPFLTRLEAREAG